MGTCHCCFSIGFRVKEHVLVAAFFHYIFICAYTNMNARFIHAEIDIYFLQLAQKGR